MHIVAHRGGNEFGLEPETWNAFSNACKYSTVLEGDIRFTDDGIFVIQHDNLVQGWNNNDREVDATKWSYFRDTFKTDQGNKIITLGSLLRICQAQGKHASVEFKLTPTNDQIRHFRAELDKYGLRNRCRVFSFNPDVIKKIRAIGGIHTGINSTLPPSVSTIRELGGWAHLNIANITAANMATYRANGIGIMAYTTNYDAEDRKAISLNVHGIVTDRPSRTLALYKESLK